MASKYPEQLDYVQRYYPNGYNKDGYDLYGYDKFGYDRLGYDYESHNRYGKTELEQLKIDNSNLKEIIKDNIDLNIKSKAKSESLVEENRKLKLDLEKAVDFYDNLSLVTTEPLFRMLKDLSHDNNVQEKVKKYAYIKELSQLPLDSTYRRGTVEERISLSLPPSNPENRYHILWVAGVRNRIDGGIERCLPSDFIISESPSDTTSYLPRWP